MLTEVLGPRLAADTGEWGSFAWTEYVLSTPGARIGGGTEEIVRNTVGEKVLGPAEGAARVNPTYSAAPWSQTSDAQG